MKPQFRAVQPTCSDMFYRQECWTSAQKKLVKFSLYRGQLDRRLLSRKPNQACRDTGTSLTSASSQLFLKAQKHPFVREMSGGVQLSQQEQIFRQKMFGLAVVTNNNRRSGLTARDTGPVFPIEASLSCAR